MLRRSIVVWLLLTALIPAVNATTVVVNSDDWMDVYSGLQFAYLSGFQAKFMTSKRYATLLPMFIPKNEKVLIIESQRVPFTINLAGSLGRLGYATETVYSGGGRATNIELAKLVNTTNYIIIDPSYGYNAIAVAPFAQLTNHYVLFADQKNIDQVLSFLNSREVGSLILYGQLDEGLVEKLGALNPEVINKGNRYKDNLEILRKYFSYQPAPQIILTDGSLIEDEIMRAGKNNEAVLLIGKDAATDDTVQFIKNSNIRAAVLIGTHLSVSAKRLKDATGVPVFIKFGQGLTRGTESEPVKALDIFPLPVIDLNMVLRKVAYNAVSKNVEITYENRGIRAFSRTSAGILADNDRVLTIGDKDVQRVEANETRGFQYVADLSEYIVEQQDLKIDLFTLYGESPDTLDHAIAITAPLPVVTVEDRCEIIVESLQYNKRTQRFLLKVENDGPVDCHADVELRDVIIEDQPTLVELPGTTAIEKGDAAVIEIKQRMTDVDLADNPDVRVRVRYGEREGLLLSVLEARLPLKEYAGTRINMTIVLLGVIGLLIIIIVVMWFVIRRRRKKQQ